MRMIDKQELKRAVRHGERELRAAGGDMLTQLSPKNIVRDARDLLIKFARDDAVQAYVAPRVWAIVPLLLVFVLVSSVCAIDIMFKAGRYLPGLFALLVGATVWTGGVVGQVYVLAIWLEGKAAQRARDERGMHVDVPPGFFAYLKYSRALVPWILILVCVLLPLAIMAARAPLVALFLFVVSLVAPFVFKKYDER
jgi:hypothetical protein